MKVRPLVPDDIPKRLMQVKHLGVVIGSFALLLEGCWTLLLPVLGDGVAKEVASMRLKKRVP
jgi:hypothetical protein